MVPVVLTHPILLFPNNTVCGEMCGRVFCVSVLLLYANKPMVFTHLVALVCLALWQRIRGQGFSRQAAGFLIHWLHQHAHSTHTNACKFKWTISIQKKRTDVDRRTNPQSLNYTMHTRTHALHSSWQPTQHFVFETNKYFTITSFFLSRQTFSFQVIQTEILIHSSVFVCNHSYSTKQSDFKQ